MAFEPHSSCITLVPLIALIPSFESLPRTAADAAAGTAGVVAIPAAGSVDDETLIAAVVRSTLWLMSADRKVTALKALQGRVWEAGFESGALRGEFYGDVQPCLESWHRRGYKVRCAEWVDG